MDRLSHTLFLILVGLLFAGCENCKSPMYAGVSAAYPGDTLVVFFDDTKVYEKVFPSFYMWSRYDMMKIVDNYCAKDSVLNVELKLLNTKQDTVFQINTRKIKGFYFSTPTISKGTYLLKYDYYDGGLRNVRWDDI